MLPKMNKTKLGPAEAGQGLGLGWGLSCNVNWTSALLMIRRSPSQIVGQEQHTATYVMLTQESTKSTQAPTRPPRACDSGETWGHLREQMQVRP